MIVLWIVLGVVLGLLILATLAFLLGKAKVRIVCNGGVRVVASILGIRFTLYPKKEQDDREKKSLRRCKNPVRALQKELAQQEKLVRKKLKALQKAKRKAAKKKKLRAKKGQPDPNLKENLQMILALLKKLYEYTHGNVKIKVNRMHVAVGAEDAAEAAIRYGVIVQLSAYILEFIETKFNHIERKDGAIEIKPDYLSESITADIDIACGVKIPHLVKMMLGMYSSYKKERRLALKKAKLRAKADAKANKTKKK